MWNIQSEKRRQTNAELDASPEPGEEAEGKDRPRDAQNRWPGKFHISRQTPGPATGQKPPARKGG